jgi:Zn-dependent protease with chaperone function
VTFVPKSPREDVNVPATHPLHQAALLVGGVFGVGALFVVVVAFSVDLLVAHVPASWEARLFPDFLTPEVEAPEEDEHRRILEELLARLAAHWPDNPYDLRIAVLRDDRPNALAFPGGVILITDGLLERAQTENELAFVMGHEFGHFRNRDHLRGLGRGLVLSLAFSAVRGSGVELLAVVETLTLRSFGREQEREADACQLPLDPPREREPHRGPPRSGRGARLAHGWQAHPAAGAFT